MAEQQQERAGVQAPEQNCVQRGLSKCLRRPPSTFQALTWTNIAGGTLGCAVFVLIVLAATGELTPHHGSATNSTPPSPTPNGTIPNSTTLSPTPSPTSPPTSPPTPPVCDGVMSQPYVVALGNGSLEPMHPVHGTQSCGQAVLGAEELVLIMQYALGRLLIVLPDAVRFLGNLTMGIDGEKAVRAELSPSANASLQKGVITWGKPPTGFGLLDGSAVVSGLTKREDSFSGVLQMPTNTPTANVSSDNGAFQGRAATSIPVRCVWNASGFALIGQAPQPKTPGSGQVALPYQGNLDPGEVTLLGPDGQPLAGFATAVKEGELIVSGLPDTLNGQCTLRYTQPNGQVQNRSFAVVGKPELTSSLVQDPQNPGGFDTRYAVNVPPEAGPRLEVNGTRLDPDAASGGQKTLFTVPQALLPGADAGNVQQKVTLFWNESGGNYSVVYPETALCNASGLEPTVDASGGCELKTSDNSTLPLDQAACAVVPGSVTATCPGSPVALGKAFSVTVDRTSSHGTVFQKGCQDSESRSMGLPPTVFTVASQGVAPQTLPLPGGVEGGTVRVDAETLPTQETTFADQKTGQPVGQCSTKTKPFAGGAMPGKEASASQSPSGDKGFFRGRPSSDVRKEAGSGDFSMPRLKR